MKNSLLYLVLLINLTSFSQKRGQIGTFIPVDYPVQSVMPKMGTNVGFGISGAYSPFFSSRMYIEFKASWGSYSTQTLQQTYMFTNGDQITTNVSYTSSLHKYLLGSKIMIGSDYNTVRGFITPQIGTANFRSRIVIADPQDEDDCQPLDQATTQRDAGFVYGGEIGAEISLDKIFKNMQTENQHKLVLSASFLNGFNHFEYVNIRYMEDEVHASDGTHPPRDITATFINVSTNQIHEHKIAELYHTSLRMIGFNIGYTFTF